VLPSSDDSFPHLIKKRKSQLGFVTHLLTFLRINITFITYDTTQKTKDSCDHIETALKSGLCCYSKAVL
jgi:hypothetical protein